MFRTRLRVCFSRVQANDFESTSRLPPRLNTTQTHLHVLDRTSPNTISIRILLWSRNIFLTPNIASSYSIFTSHSDSMMHRIFVSETLFLNILKRTYIHKNRNRVAAGEKKNERESGAKNQSSKSLSLSLSHTHTHKHSLTLSLSLITHTHTTLCMKRENERNALKKFQDFKNLEKNTQ